MRIGPGGQIDLPREKNSFFRAVFDPQEHRMGHR